MYQRKPEHDPGSAAQISNHVEEVPASCTCGISKLLLKRDDTVIVDSSSYVAIERLWLCVAMWDSRTKWLYELTYRYAAVIMDVNEAGDDSLLTDMKTAQLALL